MAIKRRSKAQVEFSMASMTDLIFLLLIFFMITASFVSPNALNLNMPKATSKVVTNPAVTISIDENKDFYFKDKKVSLDALPSLLANELQGVEEPVIMISADKSVPVDYVVKVMVIGKQMNSKVILATQPE